MLDPTNPQAFFVTLISGLVATAFAVVTLLHPGFHESKELQTILPAVCTVVGGAIGFWFVHQSHKTQQLVLKIAHDIHAAAQSAPEIQHVGGHEIP